MITTFTLQSPRGLGTTIEADYSTQTVHITNHTDNLLDTAFGVNTTPTWQDFEEFLEERCFPRTRDKMKLQLKAIGVDHYDPLTIIQKTEGRMAEDDLWLEVSYPEPTNEIENER